MPLGKYLTNRLTRSNKNLSTGSTQAQRSDCIYFSTLINRLMKENYIEESITKEDKRAIRKQIIVSNNLRAHQWDEARKFQ